MHLLKISVNMYKYTQIHTNRHKYVQVSHISDNLTDIGQHLLFKDLLNNLKYIPCKILDFRDEGMSIGRTSGNPEDLFFETF